MHADREKGKKAKDPIGFWRIMKVAYPLVYRVCPVYFSVQQVISISHGLSWGLGVWSSQVFFNTVADAVGKQLILSDIILAFAAFALTSVGQQVLNGIHNFMHGVVRNRLIDTQKCRSIKSHHEYRQLALKILLYSMISIKQITCRNLFVYPYRHNNIYVLFALLPVYAFFSIMSTRS